MIYNYTAIFTPIEGGSGYYAKVPDIPGCVTTGTDLADAIEQITDAASGCLLVAEDLGLKISEPTAQDDIPHSDDSVCSSIQIDTLAYRARTDTCSVRKNVTLPRWMARMADMRRIDCSQVLQEALLERFNKG